MALAFDTSAASSTGVRRPALLTVEDAKALFQLPGLKH